MKFASSHQTLIALLLILWTGSFLINDDAIHRCVLRTGILLVGDFILRIERTCVVIYEEYSPVDSVVCLVIL